MDSNRSGRSEGPALRTRARWFVIRAVAKAMWVTLFNLFRKPVTVHYPDKERAYPDRYRGLLALVYEKDTGEEACIGCRLCEFVCPPAVIKVEMLKSEKRNYAKTFSLELYACEFCELCVQVCPTDAIVMMKSFDMATADRREMLLDKDRLHAIGLQHQQSWATGNKLRDMQGPPKMARPEAGARRAAAAAAGRKAGRRRGVTFSDIAFWVLSIVLVGSALAVVLSKNLFHAVLWLALALTGTAGVFLLLNAEFLAAVQLLLYAGGIITIVVFAIVVTERLVGERLSQTNRGLASGAVVAVALLAVIVSTLMQRQMPMTPLPQLADLTRLVGEQVLTTFVLPFELLALLMLAAMLGAIYFARPED